MKIAGISMIRNDADIVEPFVRHTLRLLDHLFVIVHCPQDGTGQILSALHAEGLPMTLVLDDEPAFLQGERLTWLARQAYGAFGADYVFPLDADEFIVPAERSAVEAALRSIPANAVAARIRLRTFVVTSEDPVDEPNPLRRIRFRPQREAKVTKVVLAPSFAADQTLVIDHGNHGLLRVGTTAGHLQLPSIPQLALAHYPVRSADQLMNKTIIGYLAHLAAGRPSVEEKRLATHWRRCYEEMILEGATRGMSEQQLLAWFHGRQDTEVRSDRLVCDPTPAPDVLRHAHLVRTGAYATLARFTEALIRSRPGNLSAVRFEHGAETDAAKLEP
jgi:hypothetical protein